MFSDTNRKSRKQSYIWRWNKTTKVSSFLKRKLFESSVTLESGKWSQLREEKVGESEFRFHADSSQTHFLTTVSVVFTSLCRFMFLNKNRLILRFSCFPFHYFHYLLPKIWRLSYVFSQFTVSQTFCQ